MSPKEILREEIRRRLEKVELEMFKIQGAGAASLLRESGIWECYNRLFLFLSMNSEIDTTPLLESAFKDGKKVFVPKVYGQRLIFYNIKSAGGPWEKGAFGIREPAVPTRGAGESAASGDFHLALIVVPGLAFDTNGNRLGKGGGYYDRFLGELDTEGCSYAALGLCMDFQVVERVPVGEKDKKMDWVLTQNEINRAALNSGLPDYSARIKEV